MKTQIQLIKGFGSQLLETLTSQIAEYKHLYKSRKLLLKLDDHMLKDIGISKQQAVEEGNKLFWKDHAFETRQGDRIRPNSQSLPMQKDSRRDFKNPLKVGGCHY